MSNPPLHNPAHEQDNHAADEHPDTDDQFIPGLAQSVKRTAITIHDSLQIKAVEYWLKLGEADQALRELEALPSRSWTCGWALRTRIAAIGMLREQREVAL